MKSNREERVEARILMAAPLRSISSFCCTKAFAVLLFFCPALVSGQFMTPQDYYNAQLNNINGVQNARLYELNQQNRAQQAQRLRKFSQSLNRRQREIYEGSNGFFGSKRDWTSGVITVPGRLADVSKGNVTIITDLGPIREKLINFSQEDQDYIALFRSWEKAGSQNRDEWFKDHFDGLERDRLASEQEAEARAELEKQKRAELARFQKTQSFFAQITPGETTYSELIRILGNPSHGNGSEYSWLFKNPETGNRVAIRANVEDSKVVRVVEDRI